MLVMRGLPGSGKSTIVNQIKKQFPDVVSCSADDYFMSKDGVYTFKEKKLKDAHNYSHARAEEVCRLGHPLVIVDNTNVKRWEMAKYFSIAEQYMYMVVLVEPRTPWRFDPVQLAARNSHGVPRNIITKRVKEYELVTPRYFGWFLNEADSLVLLEMANSLLLRCLQTSHLFMEDFKQFSGAQSLEDMLNFYSRRNCRGVGSKILHCTSKFLRKGEARDYFDRPELGEGLGKTSVMRIGGFSFSSQTFGAKVELSDQQLALWDQDDSEMPRPQAQPSGPPRTCPPTNSDIQTHQEEKDDFALSSLRVSLLMVGQGSSQGEFGRRAHFTIGSSGSTPPACTGPETSRAVKLVRAAKYSHTETLYAGGQVVGGDLIRLAPNHWYISLDRYIVANGLFTGVY